MRHGALLLLLAGSLFACEGTWNALNRGGAATEVKALLQPHLTRDVRLRCRMVRTTRDVVCDFEASAEDVTTLVSGLRLGPVDRRASPQDDLQRLASSPPADSRCADAFGLLPGVRLYGATGTPPQLRLSQGIAFVFLLLYHDGGGSRACVWLSYSYG